MEKLFPIATAASRHLFVDPSIYGPWDIIWSGYSGERSSYIKPGVVPNLMKLCTPDGTYVTVTEEPDPDNFVIDGILFGMMDDGYWKVFRANLEIKLERLNAANWGLDNKLVIPVRKLIDVNTGKHGEGPDNIEIELSLNYARATRCLQYTTAGNYDNGKPEILGLIFDLTHKDSKSFELPFKPVTAPSVPSYRREIV